MTTFSVSDIAEDVRQLLTVPTFTASSKPTTTRVLAQIQRSTRSLAALTRQKLGRDYDLISYDAVVTQPNVNQVSLPPNFGELVKISWVKDATTQVPLDHALPSDFEPLGFNPRSWEAPVDSGYLTTRPKYSIEGNTITFYPCPSQVYNIAIWYTDHFVVTALTDNIVGRLDWDRWIALDVAMAFCSDLKRDPSVFATEKAQLEANLFNHKRKRDQQAVHSLEDINYPSLHNTDGWPF